jgi:hypothetical protein
VAQIGELTVMEGKSVEHQEQFVHLTRHPKAMGEPVHRNLSGQKISQLPERLPRSFNVGPAM